MEFPKAIPLLGILTIGLVLSSTSATATTIYYNGILAAGLGSTSDVAASDIDADDFSLTAPNTPYAVSISVVSIELAEHHKQLMVYPPDIYSDTGGSAPGTLLHTFNPGNAVNRTDTGFDIASSDIFDYSADITATTLGSGTTFWLSIFNDTTVDTDDTWSWVYANAVNTPGNNSFTTPNAGTNWFGPNTTDLSFRLDDAPFQLYRFLRQSG